MNILLIVIISLLTLVFIGVMYKYLTLVFHTNSTHFIPKNKKEQLFVIMKCIASDEFYISIKRVVFGITITTPYYKIEINKNKTIKYTTEYFKFYPNAAKIVESLSSKATNNKQPININI